VVIDGLNTTDGIGIDNITIDLVATAAARQRALPSLPRVTDSC
jgi:hypothetical protein